MYIIMSCILYTSYQLVSRPLLHPFVHPVIKPLPLYSQDAVELLEKRVKSRFSHTQLTLFNEHTFEQYTQLFCSLLTLPDKFPDRKYRDKWNTHIKVTNHYCVRTDKKEIQTALTYCIRKLIE